MEKKQGGVPKDPPGANRVKGVVKQFNMLHQIAELGSNLQCSHTKELKFETLLSFLLSVLGARSLLGDAKFVYRWLNVIHKFRRYKGLKVVRIKGINSKKSG